MSNDPYKTRVRDVMSKEVVSVLPDDTLHDCIHRLVENRVSSLPVVGLRDECIGIISSSDLMEVTQEIDDDLVGLEGADLMTGRWLLERLMAGTGHTKVSEVMSDDVITVQVDTRLANVAKVMLRNAIHHLPVVDVKGRVVGIVSTTDVLAAFVDGAPDS